MSSEENKKLKKNIWHYFNLDRLFFPTKFARNKKNLARCDLFQARSTTVEKFDEIFEEGLNNGKAN